MTDDDFTLVRDQPSGAYRRAGDHPERPFTVFVFYPFDPAAAALDVDGLEAVDGSLEEIDVLARNENDAEAIAREALAQDYQDGGTIVAVEERHPGVLYI